MKVIIAGGRDFSNYLKLRDFCDGVLSNLPFVEVVSGCATGADRIGMNYAKDKGYHIKKFPANWSKYGKSAGPIRNKEMADYADMLMAFWDGKSKGTYNMIHTALKKLMKVFICNYKSGQIHPPETIAPKESRS